jgi:hypothetical protein
LHNLPPVPVPNTEQPAANLDALVEDMCAGITYDTECEEEVVVITLDAEEGAIEHHARDAAIRAKQKEQPKRRKIKCGWHHGQFNPLSRSWRYPMNVIPVITIRQLGIP